MTAEAVSVSAPFLWIVAGADAAGKSHYHRRHVATRLRLPLVDPDRIARGRWPLAPERHTDEAVRRAAATRDALVAARRSFAVETVFASAADLAFLACAKQAGYVGWLTLVGLGSADLAVARAYLRGRETGRPAPSPDAIRAGYAGLRDRVPAAVPLVDRLMVVDNDERDRALRDVLLFEHGRATWRARDLPGWAAELFADFLRD